MIMNISYIFDAMVAPIRIVVNTPSSGLNSSRAGLVGCCHGQDYEEDGDGDDLHGGVVLVILCHQG